MNTKFDDTKMVAHLPNLDIEVIHRRPWEGNEEMLLITLRATPSFEAFFQFLDRTNPFALWARAIEMTWAPWLRLANPAANAEPKVSASAE